MAHAFRQTTLANQRMVIGGSLFAPAFQAAQHLSTAAASTTPQAPLAIAIVGSGPSGMYTAKYLTSALAKHPANQFSAHASIDVIEKLPTPFGLVRSGVAPDHPEVKNVENDFRVLFDEDDSRINFRGNVEVGKDVSLPELRSLYDVVVLAYGCESDRKLGVAGEDLVGILSAREFVGWYNGHPAYVHLTDMLSQRVITDPSTTDVAVVGHGNVALDCARVLAKGTKGLISTDIASHSLEVLSDGVRKVTVVGRRGHIQGAFTIKEIRELTKLNKEGLGVLFRVRKEELDMGMTEASMAELEGPAARPKKRIDKLLRDAAAASADLSSADANGNDRQVSLRMLMNPVEFLPSEKDPALVGSVVCERTRLEGEPGKQVAVGTGKFETIPANLALLSIGYKGLCLPGLEDSFDERRGTIDNNHGKVSGEESGLYCSGWIKRGPSGIIGTNIQDAKDTVAAIVADLEAGVLTKDNVSNVSSLRGTLGLDALLRERSTRVVDWASYAKIDAVEKEPSRLRTEEQPREKITNIQDMLSVIS